MSKNRRGKEEGRKERRGREKTGRKKENYSFTFLVAMGEDLAGPSFSFFGSCKERECDLLKSNSRSLQWQETSSNGTNGLFRALASFDKDCCYTQ